MREYEAQRILEQGDAVTLEEAIQYVKLKYGGLLVMAVQPEDLGFGICVLVMNLSLQRDFFYWRCSL